MRILGSLVLLIIVAGCTSPKLDGSKIVQNSAASERRLAILVDYTVPNRRALIQSLHDVESRLALSVDSNFTKWAGSKVEFYKINSMGETSDVSSLSVPKQKGIQRLNIAIFKRDLKKTLASIEKEVGRLSAKSIKASLYREALGQVYAKRASDIIVIGDLLVVDKDYNFERKKYGYPDRSLRVSRDTNLSLVRVPIIGQRVADIKMIEAWWAKSVFGSIHSKINRNEEILN